MEKREIDYEMGLIVTVKSTFKYTLILPNNVGKMRIPGIDCIVNAYCQFSQQGRTNFMQTHLHISIVNPFLYINDQFAVLNFHNSLQSSSKPLCKVSLAQR